MTKPRPSNAIIRIFVASAFLFGFFAIGAIINHISQQFQPDDVGTEEPVQELVNERINARSARVGSAISKEVRVAKNLPIQF